MSSPILRAKLGEAVLTILVSRGFSRTTKVDLAIRLSVVLRPASMRGFKDVRLSH